MQHNNLNNSGTMTFSKAGLADGTTTTFTTGPAVDFVIDGVWGTQFGSGGNQATPTDDHRTGSTFTALATSEGCMFAYGVIAAGSIVIVQGEIEALDSDSNEWLDGQVPQPPLIPDTMCVFGTRVVKNGSTGSAWTLGAGSFDDTGIVSTYTDVSVMEDRPQVS